MKTQNQVNEIETKIETLAGEVTRMKNVLPQVKQFGARRKIGELIRRYQQDIQNLRREIISLKF